MSEISFSSLLTGLPPQSNQNLLAEIQQQVFTSRRKLVILDDDPTGTQTVSNISVLTEWSVPSLIAELATNSPAFFILTNSRSLPPQEAEILNHTIGMNLKNAAQIAKKEFVIISRGDSTLRGHFPNEVQALADGLEMHFDGWILAPYFREGNRYTIADTHYVVNGDKAFPVGKTEFARDPAFSFTESNLCLWIEEKTKGKTKAEDVVSVSISDIRTGGVEKVRKIFENLKHGQICILNATCDLDIEICVLALLLAESNGKRFLHRTAASFVRARAGIAPKKLLSSEDFKTDNKNGGLVIIGSFVPKTTAQLEILRQKFSFLEFELNVEELLDPEISEKILTCTHQSITEAVSAGKDVLLFTSRKLISGKNSADSLKIGKLISKNLVSCVQNLAVCPRFLIVKGGVTSSNIATQGLNVRKAKVLGQIIPGVPVWQPGQESRFPDIPYIVFPGNVGDQHALSDVFSVFQKP